MIVQSLFIKSNQIDIFISVNNFIGTMTEGGGVWVEKEIHWWGGRAKNSFSYTRKVYFLCVPSCCHDEIVEAEMRKSKNENSFKKVEKFFLSHCLLFGVSDFFGTEYTTRNKCFMWFACMRHSWQRHNEKRNKHTHSPVTRIV